MRRVWGEDVPLEGYGSKGVLLSRAKARNGLVLLGARSPDERRRWWWGRMGVLCKRRQWSGVELAGAARVLWVKSMPGPNIPVGQLAAPKAIIHAHAPSLTSMCTALAHVRGSQVARLVWHLRHAAVFESLVSSRMMLPLVVRCWGCECE